MYQPKLYDKIDMVDVLLRHKKKPTEEIRRIVDRRYPYLSAEFARHFPKPQETEEPKGEAKPKKVAKPKEAAKPKESDAPQYKDGGRVKKTGLALVHKGEVVVPAHRVETVDKALRKQGLKPLKK